MLHRKHSGMARPIQALPPLALACARDSHSAIMFGLIALEQGATADAITALACCCAVGARQRENHGDLGIAIRQTGVLSAEPDDLLTPPTEVSALCGSPSALEPQ